jgi:PAS domain S-box-containing protein
MKITRSAAFLPLAMLALGLLLAAAAGRWQAEENALVAQRRFELLTNRATEQLVTRMQTYAYGLRGARGAIIAAGGEITPERFGEYSASRDIAAEFPGARGYGFIRRVPRDRQAAFVATVRHLGQPDFAVRQLSPHDGERYVIEFLEPLAGNLAALGLDIASEPNRRAAAERAMRSGAPALSGPITLVQATGQPQRSFLMLLPVLRPGDASPSPTAREAATIGWVYAPLVIDEVLRSFDFRDGEFAMSLHDVTEGGHAEPFFVSGSAGQAAPDAPMRRVTLPLFGRSWDVEVRALKPFMAQLNQRNPLGVAFSIAAVVSLLAGLLYIFLLSVQRGVQASVQQSRLAAIVGSANDAVIGTTLGGKVTDWNAAAERIFGWRAEEAVGRRLGDLTMDAERREDDARLLARVRRGESVAAFDTLRHDRQGQEIHVSVSASPIHGSDGRVIGVAKTVRDIRAQKAAERQVLELNASLERQVAERTAQLEAARAALEERTAQAEAASAAKSEFLANMSHEIRTPMNAVMGLTYLLEQSRLGTDQRGFVEKIKLASKSLLGVINDILDLSKVEAGQMALDEQVFSLPALLDETLGLMAVNAADKRLELALEAGPGLPAALRGDPQRLQQILVNLLGNAIKFTAAGRVCLAVHCEDRDEGRARLRFTIQDTGIGITPDTLARLFTPFTQADTSTTRRFGGTGLGLSIVKRLAELMGGEAGARSTPGAGSEFWVTLHLSIAEGAASAPATQLLEMLIVEDDETQREALATAARALGWRTETAGSGESALDRVRQRQAAGQAFDALVLDWKLPGIDGLEVLAALHRQLGKERTPAVVMVTAHDRDRLAAAPNAALADALLSKPVTSSSLFNAVHTAVARRTGGSQRVARTNGLDGAAGRRLDGVRVLLVDDSPINLEVGQRLLEKEGALVTLAGDGLQAVLRLQAEPAGFDAVLMDVQMPVLDGNDATRRIRTELALAALPVIALTAGALASERQRALAAGMNDFLSKPFDVDALVRCLRRHVERGRGGSLPVVGPASAPSPETAQPPSPQASASIEGWPLVEGIDAADAQVRLSGDAALFTRLLRRLLDEYRDLARAPAWPSDEAARAALAARLHRLRGAAGSLGANALHRHAGEAEHALRAEDENQASAALAAMAEAVAGLIESAQAQAAAPAEKARHIVTVPAASAIAEAHEPAAFDPARLGELLTLLRGNDLAALHAFGELEPALGKRLGGARCATVRAALDELRFADAADVLAQALG